MAADRTTSEGQRRHRRASETAATGSLRSTPSFLTAADDAQPLADTATSSAALAPDEWRAGIAQRRALTILGFRESVMSLIGTAPDGEDATLSIEPDQRLALAAAALHGVDDGFTLQDCNDEILVAVLLASYERGVPFSELGAPLRSAVRDLIARRGDLARRLAALIPPAG